MTFPFKAVVFDLDGTLIDSIRVWNEVEGRFLATLGVNGNKQEIWQLREDKLREYALLPHPYLAWCGYAAETWAPGETAQSLYDRRFAIADPDLREKVSYKPFAPELLHMLKKMGLSLAIATTTKRKTLEIYINENIPINREAPIRELFDFCLCRDDVGLSKPYPDIYLQAAENLGLAPGDCLAFEDSLAGAEAVLAAGMNLALIHDPYSDGDREKLKEMTELNFRDFRQAIDWVKGLLKNE